MKLIHGDYLNEIKTLADETIDAIVTDISYNISQANNFATMKDRTGRVGIDFGEWDKKFDEDALVDLVRLLKPGGSMVLFHAFEQYSKLQKIFKALSFKDKVIWQKTNPMPRNRDRR